MTSPPTAGKVARWKLIFLRKLSKILLTGWHWGMTATPCTRFCQTRWIQIYPVFPFDSSISLFLKLSWLYSWNYHEIYGLGGPPGEPHDGGEGTGLHLWDGRRPRQADQGDQGGSACRTIYISQVNNVHLRWLNCQWSILSCLTHLESLSPKECCSMVPLALVGFLMNLNIQNIV